MAVLQDEREATALALLNELRPAAELEAAKSPNALVTHKEGDVPEVSIFRMENATGVYVDQRPDGSFDCKVRFFADEVEQLIGNPDDQPRKTYEEALAVGSFVLRQAARNSLFSPDNRQRFDLGTFQIHVPRTLVDNVDELFPKMVGGDIRGTLDRLLTSLLAMQADGRIVGNEAKTPDAKELVEAAQACSVIALSQGMTRWPETAN